MAERSVNIPGLGRYYWKRWNIRRKDGSSTLYENPKIWIEYRHHGKVFAESARTTEPKHAIKLLRKRVEALGQSANPSREDRVTFDALKEMLIGDYKVNNKRSLASAELSARHLTEFFDGYKAVDIQYDVVLKYIQRRQDEGAANASINRELAALKRMFTLACKARLLFSKPHIPTLEENNTRQGFVDHASFLAIVGNLNNYLHDVVLFAYLTAMRIGAIRSLEHRHVDYAGGVINLPPELAKNKRGQVIPLRGELLKLLERVRANRRPDCPYLFHRDGQRIGDFRKAWQSACVAAGQGQFIDEQDAIKKRKRKKYDGILVHDLRRSAVRNIVRAGIPEKLAMGLSGHKTRSVFDRYNILNEDDLAQASERLQGYLAAQNQTPKVTPMTKAESK